MRGSTKRTTQTIGVPKDWMLHHYKDREQPWTLLTRYFGHGRGFYRNWAVEGFFATREEATRRAQ